MELKPPSEPAGVGYSHFCSGEIKVTMIDCLKNTGESRKKEAARWSCLTHSFTVIMGGDWLLDSCQGQPDMDDTNVINLQGLVASVDNCLSRIWPNRNIPVALIFPVRNFSLFHNKIHLKFFLKKVACFFFLSFFFERNQRGNFIVVVFFLEKKEILHKWCHRSSLNCFRKHR